jgi:hypothetical protein
MRLAFALLNRNAIDSAVRHLHEALEWHFRLIDAHGKVGEMLESESEEWFYEKHSWWNYPSIFVTCLLLPMSTEGVAGKMLAKRVTFGHRKGD